MAKLQISKETGSKFSAEFSIILNILERIKSSWLVRGNGQEGTGNGEQGLVKNGTSLKNGAYLRSA